MAKLPDEIIKAIYDKGYDKGYAQGKADAYAEMADTIAFLSRAARKAIEAEIKEIKEKQGLI